MAKIPGPNDIGFATIGSPPGAPQVNTGVIMQNASARAAIGNAMGDIGEAFGNIVGRIGKAQEAVSSARSDFEFDKKAGEAYQWYQDNEDGSGTAFPEFQRRLKEADDAHPVGGMGADGERRRLKRDGYIYSYGDRATNGVFRPRAYNARLQEVEGVVQSSLAEMDTADPKSKNYSQESDVADYDSYGVATDIAERRKQQIFGMIDAYGPDAQGKPGVVFNKMQADALKKRVELEFLRKRYNMAPAHEKEVLGQQIMTWEKEDGKIGEAAGSLPRDASARVLASDRKRFFDELDNDPQLAAVVRGLIRKENYENPHVILEAMMNRASMRNSSIRKEVFGGFYGPINRKEVQPKGWDDVTKKAFDRVRSGSNDIQLLTDQGYVGYYQGRFRNEHQPALRIGIQPTKILGEHFSPMGREGVAWRQRMERMIADEAKRGEVDGATSQVIQGGQGSDELRGGAGVGQAGQLLAPTQEERELMDSWGPPQENPNGTMRVLPGSGNDDGIVRNQMIDRMNEGGVGIEAPPLMQRINALQSADPDLKLAEALSPEELDQLPEDVKIAAADITVGEAREALGIQSSAAGMIEPGNIDLTKRKVLKNQDGSISTISSMSVNFDGQEVLIPTVIDGVRVSEDEAIEHYRRTGQHLGKFDTPENAEAYAKAISSQQGDRYSDQPQTDEELLQGAEGTDELDGGGPAAVAPVQRKVPETTSKAPAAPSTFEELVTRRFKPGQRATIGGYTVTSDFLNTLNAKERKALFGEMQQNLETQRRKNSFKATAMAKNAEASMLETGRADGYDEGIAKAGMTSQQFFDHRVKLATNQQIYRIRTTAAEDGMAGVDAAIQQVESSEDIPPAARRTIVGSLMKERAEIEKRLTPQYEGRGPNLAYDPVAVVDGDKTKHSAVAKVRGTFANGRADNAENAARLVDARKEAQIELGIPPEAIKVLTKKERAEMAGILYGATEADIPERMSRLWNDAARRVGPRHAEAAMKEVVQGYTRGEIQASAMASIGAPRAMVNEPMPPADLIPKVDNSVSAQDKQRFMDLRNPQVQDTIKKVIPYWRDMKTTPPPKLESAPQGEAAKPGPNDAFYPNSARFNLRSLLTMGSNPYPYKTDGSQRWMPKQ